MKSHESVVLVEGEDKVLQQVDATIRVFYQLCPSTYICISETSETSEAVCFGFYNRNVLYIY